MNIQWTEAALADLRAAEAYVARHSERYATSLVERIFSRTGQLGDQPYLGGMVPEHEDEMLREVFEHPYRIIYRLLKDQIDVVAVVHGSRRLPRGLS
jgi:plasmid stabilization system protein ParE